MTWLLMPLAVLAGIASCLQTGSNTALLKTSGTPFWTVAIVSTITCLASILVALLVGERWPAASLLGQVPWWSWIGGLFGLGYVIAMVEVAPAVGAGVFVGLSVTAGTVASLLLDHFGLMGFEVHRAGIGRIAGGLLMIAGVALVAIF